MKKLSVIVAMALAAVVNYSCGEYDNAVDNGKTVFVDENGQKRPVDLDAMFYGTPAATIEQLKMVLSKDNDTVFVKTGDENPIMIAADDNNTVDFKDFIVGDDGVIKIYSSKGSDILSLTVVGDATPVAYDQPKLQNVESIIIKKATIDVIKLPALKKLTTFSLQNCEGINSLDVSEATALQNLYVQNTTNSHLYNIDLSNNTELIKLRIYGSKDTPGELKAIDLSNNLKLEQIYLQFNKLEYIKLADYYENLKQFNGQNNKLKELDMSGKYMPNLTTLYLLNNELTSFDAPIVGNDELDFNIRNNLLTSLTAPEKVKNLYCDNKNGENENRLTFITIPEVIASGTFAYNPQADIEVNLVNNTLDLSYLLYRDGIETVYKINGFEEGNDYVVLEPGVFKFTKKLSNVVVSMTNEKFPKFTDEKPLKTVAFDTNDPSNEVFTWGYIGQDEFISGGKLTVVPIDMEVYPWSHKVGYWKNLYATLLIDGTQESFDSNYVRIDLDEPLKKGMKVSFTGFRYAGETNSDANLFLLFALPNYKNCDTYPDYLPNEFDYTGYQFTTFGWGLPYMFNNIKGTSLTPSKYTFIVDETLENVKSFKIAREYHDTEIYLTKIEILRQ